MSGHTFAVTGPVCPLCDGPCREPLVIPPIPPRYPFIDEETAAMLNAKHDPPPIEPTPAERRRARRGQRPHEDRAVRPVDDRAEQASEDRA